MNLFIELQKISLYLQEIPYDRIYINYDLSIIKVCPLSILLPISSYLPEKSELINKKNSLHLPDSIIFNI